LAAGCIVVIKPLSKTLLCTLAINHLAQKARIPLEAIQVVLTCNCSAVTKLYTNLIVKKVSFTSSTSVSKLITEKAARTIKKVSIELSSNAPFIVFNNADLDKAIKGVIACKYCCLG
jgi:succinate-semialdehyde dehydrogenase/glutarate-semialdehyde dehydrogenase